MAKPAYKWPRDLTMTNLDIAVNLRTDSGMGFDRPITLRAIVTALGCLFVGAYLTVYGIVSEGGLAAQTVFAIGWVVLSVALVRNDQAGEPMYRRLSLLPAAFSRRMRHVGTRNSENASDFLRLSNIESIDEREGRIHFVDGTLGYAFRVEGAASVLRFDDDSDRLIDDVDDFYRNMGLDYELIWVTHVEAQRTDRQVDALAERRMRAGDPAIAALCDMEAAQLRDRVSVECSSLHQYLIIKGYGMTGLRDGFGKVDSEVGSSSPYRMLNRCIQIYDDELTDLLATPFTYRRARRDGRR